MSGIFIRGIGMTQIGLQLDRSLKQMTAEAIALALDDADLERGDIDGLFFGNCLAGLIIGVEATRAPITCLPAGFGEIPIHAIENACATGGDALHMAYMAIASGLHETVLVVGAEKANHEDRQKAFKAMRGGLDPDEDLEKSFELSDGAGENRTLAVDRHALIARRRMAEFGLEIEDLARLCAVNYSNAARNPLAHRRSGPTAEKILADRVVVPPLTRLMMCPISDGAAAVVISAKRGGAKSGGHVRVAASRTATRSRLDDPGGPPAAKSASTRAYSDLGITAADLGCAELHDASVAYLLLAMEDTGICPAEEQLDWIRGGATRIEGHFPINMSGGSLARGHAPGATGVAQICELVSQFRGTSAGRQIPNRPELALACCAGGTIQFETAVASVHVLTRD